MRGFRTFSNKRTLRRKPGIPGFLLFSCSFPRHTDSHLSY
ncbi:hypothetical protein HMPREF3196_01389 [Bifidobacterium bifidum]|uniref:Uncharacterized protein n=1 Tax=Bifidobacterium bifidum TaxID=1681 RepID=A0A133KN62_BIFBI|nr:hypothetical protein HMPREF3196_01389 [Bifidobacterium bifidum]